MRGFLGIVIGAIILLSWAHAQESGGTLTITGLTLEGGSVITTAPGATYDAQQGTLTLDGSQLVFGSVGVTVLTITGGSGTAVDTGMLTFDLSNSTLDPNAFSFIYQPDTNSYLLYYEVPEPTSLLLILTGTGLLIASQCKRLRC